MSTIQAFRSRVRETFVSLRIQEATSHDKMSAPKETVTVTLQTGPVHLPMD